MQKKPFLFVEVEDEIFETINWDLPGVRKRPQASGLMRRHSGSVCSTGLTKGRDGLSGVKL